MAKERIIRFPDRIHRYRLITVIEADVFFLAAVSFVGIVFLLAFLGLKGKAFLIGAGISGTATYVYVFYKEKFKRGFLEHWAYTRGLRDPKYEGEEDLPIDFLPKGYDNEFRD
ncbi:hypothetical protein CQA49_06880 [Helicobacter sp. MIT 00-7814]|uniref:hypothetical protein n=1 Tax=unclassified Helicobacter TaxID=2593540 RepID=UPI000E1F1986|nr:MULTISPECIES: hypothetical protein [unclassified Helicobacter]RDU53366.1 hypothetical protein CQA49_06880 [Helicobacter sp. MIT 00-7814]RDU54187.1 hypothetical protein CQA37_06120 [Helicobacter sp. MIT 99-10781]